MARLKPGFVRPPTTQEAVLAELRRAILHGDLAPGTPLVQEEIAHGFRLSRVPVREALRMLEGEGHVVYRPHRGYVVAELAHEDLTEISRLRELLESDAVRRAMARPGNCDLGAMREHLEEMGQAARQRDIAAYAHADRAFHLCLITPCGRAWLTRIIEQLWDASAPYRALLYALPEYTVRARTEHEAILAAASALDPERVVALLTEHRATAIDDVGRILRARAADR